MYDVVFMQVGDDFAKAFDDEDRLCRSQPALLIDNTLKCFS